MRIIDEFENPQVGDPALVFTPVLPDMWEKTATTITFPMQSVLGQELYEFYVGRGSAEHKARKLTLETVVSIVQGRTTDKTKMIIRRDFIMKKEWYMTPFCDALQNKYLS
jgi:hypothetical protein